MRDRDQRNEIVGAARDGRLAFSRFIPCQPGAHFTSLIHPGWGHCGRGRPRVEMPFSQALLDVLGYPDGAASKLFCGILNHRYSGTFFARKFPSWPVHHQSRLVPADVQPLLIVVLLCSLLLTREKVEQLTTAPALLANLRTLVTRDATV